jgi:hypothetical protein
MRRTNQLKLFRRIICCSNRTKCASALRWASAELCLVTMRCISFYKANNLNTHTHTHIYIYICVCVCVHIYICIYICVYIYTRWFKYDRNKLWLVYTQIVPVIFEPPCTYIYIYIHTHTQYFLLHVLAVDRHFHGVTPIFKIRQNMVNVEW